MLKAFELYFEIVPAYGLDYLRVVDVKLPNHAAKLNKKSTVKVLV
jgi:hypothetical protein